MPEPPNPIVELMLEFRRALEKHDRRAMGRLVDAYERVYGRLKDKIELLENLIRIENPTMGQLVRKAQYQSLIAQVEVELTKYQAILADEVQAVGKEAIAFAGRDTARLVQAINAEYGLGDTFSRLPVDAIETLLGFLAPDSPLFQRIETLAPFYAKEVADTIVEAVALGKGPRQVARLIRDSLGGGMTDALRMTRTVQLWSYRESSRANYIANSDFIEGWYWSAAIGASPEPCMACIAEHGTFHNLDEVLDGHYNCRCAELPAIKGFPNPIEQSGAEWFEGLPESQQRELMGPRKWQAWRDNRFEFNQLIGKHTDDVYGEMTIEASLKSLIGEEE